MEPGVNLQKPRHLPQEGVLHDSMFPMASPQSQAGSGGKSGDGGEGAPGLQTASGGASLPSSSAQHKPDPPGLTLTVATSHLHLNLLLVFVSIPNGAILVLWPGKYLKPPPVGQNLVLPDFIFPIA